MAADKDGLTGTHKQSFTSDFIVLILKLFFVTSLTTLTEIKGFNSRDVDLELLFLCADRKIRSQEHTQRGRRALKWIMSLVYPGIVSHAFSVLVSLAAVISISKRRLFLKGTDLFTSPSAARKRAVHFY